MMWLSLLAIGLFVGTLGTLIGAGGGFILVPILLYLYPHEDPNQLTAVSLVIVFLNATSGSIAYGRKKRIDYRSGVRFALASIPGAVLGAWVTSLVDRTRFSSILGLSLILIALYLIFRSKTSQTKKTENVGANQYTLVDAHGISHVLNFNLKVGVAISVAISFLSSFLGIGGGIIHVPALVHVLHFPIHIATATSHFILAIVAFIGTVEHLIAGDLVGMGPRILALAPGVLVGAQLGAALSHKVTGRSILIALALALLTVGLRLLFIH